MQENYTANTPDSYETAVMFGAMAEDVAETGHLDAMPCIQIVHYDETDKPVKTETVPISVFLQSAS